MAFAGIAAIVARLPLGNSHISSLAAADARPRPSEPRVHAQVRLSIENTNRVLIIKKLVNMLKNTEQLAAQEQGAPHRVLLRLVAPEPEARYASFHGLRAASHPPCIRASS